MTVQLFRGDCLDVMKTMDPESVTGVITDPPYGLSFMGKEWDHGIPGKPFWVEALRVTKPGGFLFAFGGTRTFHRLTCAIEDAGWEIRDCIMWVYGQGFPKSNDISKAIDKEAGHSGYNGPMKLGGERLAKLRNGKRNGEGKWGNEVGRNPYVYKATSKLGILWSGYGTALKPSWEPIIVAMKPLQGTYAKNAMEQGVAGLNIEEGMIGTDPVKINTFDSGMKPFGNGAGHDYTGRMSTGRWPANLIHDGSEEVTRLFPDVKGGAFPKTQNTKSWKMSSMGKGLSPSRKMNDSGSASRFFYCAKASTSERTHNGTIDNRHPTVKPLKLMEYLVTLLTMPENTVILDPFMGSGSTGVACANKGVGFIGIEKDLDSFETARRRIQVGETVTDDEDVEDKRYDQPTQLELFA